MLDINCRNITADRPPVLLAAGPVLLRPLGMAGNEDGLPGGEVAVGLANEVDELAAQPPRKSRMRVKAFSHCARSSDAS